MLEKIINSMMHGSVKTKLYLWSIVLFAVAALALLVTALALGMPFLGAGGLGAGLVSLIISQSFSLNDIDKPKKKKGPKKEKQAKAGDGGTGEHSGKNSRENEEGENDDAARKKRDREKTKYLSSLNSKSLKKLMKEHKVDQIHVKVMIDSYKAQKIEQAPAFMWKTDTMLHFMILTGSAQEFEVPLEDIKGILLVKDVPVEPERDYLFFKFSNFISNMFQPYLPEYFEKTKDGELVVTKNTFRIEPGIYLTNTSVGNLRRVLLPGVAFLVDDKVNSSDRFNEYFKEIYRNSILCKNLVVTLDEYKELTEKTLDALLDAPISGKEFVGTIYDLNKYHLINRDFVVKYTQKYREKTERGM